MGKTEEDIRTELEKREPEEQLKNFITEHGLQEGDILREIFYDAVEHLEKTPEPKQSHAISVLENF